MQRQLRRLFLMLLLLVVFFTLVACVRPNSPATTEESTDVPATATSLPLLTATATIASEANVLPIEADVHRGVLKRVWPIPETEFVNISFTSYGEQSFCVVPEVADYAQLYAFFDEETLVNIQATTLDTATGDSAACQKIREVIPGIENYKQILVAVSITAIQP